MSDYNKEIKALLAQGKIKVKQRPDKKAKAAAFAAGSPFDGKRKDYSQYKKLHEVTGETARIIPPAPEELLRRQAILTDNAKLEGVDSEIAASELAFDIEAAAVQDDVGIAPMALTSVTPYLPQNTNETPTEVETPQGFAPNGNEIAQLNTGDLIYEVTDFTLPGVNGLDLEVKRRYNSATAKEHEFTFEANSYSAYWYYVHPIPTDTIPVEVGGPYIDQVDRNNARRYALDRWDTDIYAATNVTQRNYYCYKTALRPNTQYVEDHLLGYGWRFAFPSIETLPDSFSKVSGIRYRDYLHLGDGRNYKILNGKLEDHNLQDFTFASSTGSITFPDSSSHAYQYVVTFKDGKQYFLNKRNIVAIRDRFGNQICFSFTGSGINIWDSAKRLTKLEKVNVVNANNYQLRWTLPDGRTMLYRVDNRLLTAHTDFAGQTFYYDYQSVSTSARLFYDYSGDEGATTTTHLLYLVEYPTGAATVWDWTRMTYSVGEPYDYGGRYRHVYLLTGRQDQEIVYGSQVVRNPKAYAYSINIKIENKTGNDVHLEWQMEYRIGTATVTDPVRGMVTRHSFNDDGLQTSESCTALWRQHLFGNQNLQRKQAPPDPEPHHPGQQLSGGEPLLDMGCLRQYAL